MKMMTANASYLTDTILGTLLTLSTIIIPTLSWVEKKLMLREIHYLAPSYPVFK